MVDASNNAATYFVDRHAHGGHAHKTAFVEGSRSLTYSDLHSVAAKMKDLYTRHGIRGEDRAAMIVLDVLEFPIIFWGSLKAGIIPVPLNTLLSADYYDVILRDSRAKALFVSKELLEVVGPAIRNSPFLKGVFVVGDTEHPFMPFEAELQKSTASPTEGVSSDDCAFWLYSSGSTGRPKGVRHVHSSLRATADCFGSQVLGIEPDDTVFSAAKLFFAYGLGNGMTFPMSVGATAILSPTRPTPSNIMRVMAAARPSIYCGVPTLYASLLDEMAGSLPTGFDRLRLCISAGEALPEHIGQRWTTLTGVEIIDGVGSTEMLHIFLSNRPGSVVYGTSGIAVPGYNLRLVDEQGRDVDDQELGELLVDGPSAADGYWNQREKSRATFEGLWTRTGDKYERRSDGRFVYHGRTDDMFKVSGIWVSPAEIEHALVGHPDVLEAAVVPATDEHGLEKPKAFVVVRRNVDTATLAASLKEYVKERVGKWKYPRWIEIIDELPKTATGKIQRFKLRQATETH